MSLDPLLVRAARSAAETSRPIVSDLLIGAVANSLVLVVNVPVLRDGEPIYITNLPLPPERILAVLATREFPRIRRRGVSTAASSHRAINR